MTTKETEQETDIALFARQAHTRRRGRLTKAQARGLQLLEQRFGALPEDVNKASADGAVGIEIGFGMGQALLAWAQTHPHLSLFGIELYQPGIGALCDGLEKQGSQNVGVIETPAQEVFADLNQGCVSELRIFFPDPWPKTRHLKRRLIQPEFLRSIERVLKPGGVLRIATDWEPYAKWMRRCLQDSDLAEVASVVRVSDEVEIGDRETTKFEARGLRLGHQIYDFEYRKGLTSLLAR